MYLFSIVVPCYNVSGRINALLDMLLSKDYSNYEVVLVDDCSKDDSYEKLLEKSASHPNFKVVQPPKNGGPGPARNFGISNASGKYILFCDSDDIFDITCLPKIDEFLQRYPDADIVASPHLLDRSQKETFADNYSKYKNGEKMRPEDIVVGNLAPWAKVYRRDIIIENGVEFPARMTGEDACFVINYAVYAKNVYKLELAYYTYIMNDESITHKHREDWQMPTTFELLLPIYQEHFPSVEVQRFIESHLLTKAKIMTDAHCKNSEIKKWFKKENKRYPDWYAQTENLDRSLYRRMIYFAMHKSSPILIKLVMLIRRVLY